MADKTVAFPTTLNCQAPAECLAEDVVFGRSSMREGFATVRAQAAAGSSPFD